MEPAFKTKGSCGWLAGQTGRRRGGRAREATRVAKIQWWGENYEDTRSSRGTEVSNENFIEIKEEGWYGFSFWVNSSGEIS